METAMPLVPLKPSESGFSFWLMQERYSTKGTGQKCVGLFNMHGHPVLSTYSIATGTGQSLWSKPETAYHTMHFTMGITK
jgi:hypothetical protein